MTVGLTDEEFVGYDFRSAPERRSRLWFLDRHVLWLLHDCRCRPGHFISGADGGTGMWTAEAGTHLPDLEGCLLRYQHLRTVNKPDEPWTAVWRLTHVVIPHVVTFGDDDTWRLGLWPD